MQYVELIQPRAARLLDSALSADSGCVVVQGESASGKTTLLRRVLDKFRDRCIFLTVLPGGKADQQVLVSAAVAQLKDLVLDAGANQRLVDELLAIESHSESQTSLAAVVEQIPRLVTREMPELGPIWIAIDDVHLLDSELLDALTYSIACTAHRPGGIVCTTSQPIAALEAYRHIILDPLDPEAVSAWIEARTGLSVPERVARQLHSWSSGSTEILSELILGVTPHGLEGKHQLIAAPPGEAASRYAEDTLSGVEPSTHDLLVLLSVVGGLDLPAFNEVARRFAVDQEQMLAEQWVASDGARIHIADGVLERWLSGERGQDMAVKCERILQTARASLSREERAVLSSWTSSCEPDNVEVLKRATIEAVLAGNSRRAERTLSALARCAGQEEYSALAVARAVVAFLEGHLQNTVDVVKSDLGRLPYSSGRLYLALMLAVSQVGLGRDLNGGLILNELRLHVKTEPRGTAEVGLKAAFLALYAGDVRAAREISTFVDESVSAAHTSSIAWQYLRIRLAQGVSVSLVRQLLEDWMLQEKPRGLPPELQLEIALRGDPEVAAYELRSELGRSIPPIQRAFLLLLLASVEVTRGDVEQGSSSREKLNRLSPVSCFEPLSRAALALKVAVLQGQALDDRYHSAAETGAQHESQLGLRRVMIARTAWALGAGESWAQAEELVESMLFADSRPEVPELAGLGDVDLQLVGPCLVLGMLLRQGRTRSAKNYYRHWIIERRKTSQYAEAAAEFGAKLGLEPEAVMELGEIDLEVFPSWARPAISRLLEALGEESSRAVGGKVVIRNDLQGRQLSLSTREAEVARRILAGKRNKDIASDLYLSVRSVESVVTQLLRKTETTSRAGLAAVLLQGQAPPIETRAPGVEKQRSEKKRSSRSSNSHREEGKSGTSRLSSRPR